MSLQVTSNSHLTRSLHVLLVLACSGALLSCGGGGGDDVLSPTLSASFVTSGMPASPDTVHLSGETSGNLVTVQVSITGPTTSADLYAFAFDLVLGSPEIARYENGSARLGSALTLDDEQGSSVLAAQVGDRVVVGVTKTGGGSGNGIGATDGVVVSLTFRVLQVGSTSVAFAGSPGSGGPAALDPGGSVIGAIHFDAAPAWLSGS